MSSSQNNSPRNLHYRTEIPHDVRNEPSFSIHHDEAENEFDFASGSEDNINFNMDNHAQDLDELNQNHSNKGDERSGTKTILIKLLKAHWVILTGFFLAYSSMGIGLSVVGPTLIQIGRQVCTNRYTRQISTMSNFFLFFKQILVNIF